MYCCALALASTSGTCRSRIAPKWCLTGSNFDAASKGETGIQDAASADAADMIARAKAKAKQLEGPGISVLHEASFQPPHVPHPA